MQDNNAIDQEYHEQDPKIVHLGEWVSSHDGTQEARAVVLEIGGGNGASQFQAGVEVSRLGGDGPTFFSDNDFISLAEAQSEAEDLRNRALEPAAQELVGELYRDFSTHDNAEIQEAIENGDRAEVLAAITQVNQSEQAFMEQAAALNASQDEIQGLVVRFQSEADDDRAALGIRLQQTMAEETGKHVWPAKDGMAYNGPVVDRDAVYQYQQVAPNTLIAHPADKVVEAPDKGYSWMRGVGQDEEQGLEQGYGR